MINEDYLLKGTIAKELYKSKAEKAPIYDYHCHLSPKEIYEDKPFESISKIFLEFDHYKWRAMRYAGVPEKYVTGDGDDLAKFKHWARTCERLIGSPLNHWTNLELNKYFGINEELREANAERIYNTCNSKIKAESMSPIKVIEASKVKLICTTDDPIDTLEYHKLIMEKKELSFKVLPTFRPDKALNPLKEDFEEYIENLSKASDVKIDSYSSYQQALINRLDYFSDLGCLLSDHSLESFISCSCSLEEAESILLRAINKEQVTALEADKFKLLTLKWLAGEYRQRGFVMQLHLGAMRNNNSRMFARLGADAGFDVMNDFNVAESLSSFLKEIDSRGELPKTVLYTLNPKDNIVLSALPHCFAEDGIAGKVQFGSAWWFNDHIDGMREQLKAIGNQGMLAYFVGMLTDSRSFLSYGRHDYFRRILCTLLGEMVEAQDFEYNQKIFAEITENICYKNIMNYLNIEEE